MCLYSVQFIYSQAPPPDAPAEAVPPSVDKCLLLVTVNNALKHLLIFASHVTSQS